MRQSRLLQNGGDACYHVVSRVVDKRFIFNAREKNHFHRWMRKLEAFCGVEVLTYCLMSNHFHLLVRVPDREVMPKLTKETLLELLPILYDETRRLGIEQELQRAEASTDPAWLAGILARFELRRYDLASFVKDLKQRFTRWYNRENQRRGTLWEDRYKSVLVEGAESALLTMAAYIDLNPVRAGMVGSPEDYRWCGYAEAVAGKRAPRRGLSSIFAKTRDGEGRSIPWEETSARYRLLLFGEGEARPAEEGSGAKSRPGFSTERVEAEVGRGGKLSVPEILRCRVRYFCDGAIFGTVDYVNGIFEANRWRYGPKRKSGARKLRGGADWGELRVLRDLRVSPVG